MYAKKKVYVTYTKKKKTFCRKRTRLTPKKKSDLRLFPQSSYSFLNVGGLTIGLAPVDRGTDSPCILPFMAEKGMGPPGRPCEKRSAGDAGFKNAPECEKNDPPPLWTPHAHAPGVGVRNRNVPPPLPSASPAHQRCCGAQAAVHSPFGF